MAEVPFAIGSHAVTLTVMDRAGASGSDDLAIDVVDTTPPVGGITRPSPGQCFGSGVQVEYEFSELCDPGRFAIAFDPAGGPTYTEHGDYAVIVTATDPSGNAAQPAVTFTIDLVPPVVTLLPWPGQRALPALIPFDGLFTATDTDGARGGVVHEVVQVDGCAVYDGLTFGDADGLLSDESVLAGEDELCRLVRLCGRREWRNPVITVTAFDCAGNTVTAAMVASAGFRVPPTRCP